MGENESTFYAQIPITVMYDDRLKPIERLLYGTISMLSKKSGYCYASNGYFAELYKCSEMAISKYIKNLSLYGYVTIENANSYKRQIFMSNLKQMINEPITNDIGTYNKCYRNIKQTYEHNNNNKLKNNLNKVIDKNNTNELNEDFVIFWKAYPKHKGKPVAEKAFARAIKKVELDTMLEAIRKQKQSGQWRKDNGQYIPYPATWLNQERWNDEPDDCMGNGFYNHPSHGKNDIHSGLAMALDLIQGSEDG